MGSLTCWLSYHTVKLPRDLPLLTRTIRLVSHPAVAESAVIGKPDALKGESIKAFVILRVGFSPSEELAGDLKKHVRVELSPIAMPGEIEFVTSLPKTRSGKIMRRVLKAQELGTATGDVSTLED